MNRCPLFLLILLSISLQFVDGKAASKTNKISAVYAFGDAVFDAGNNNHLLTICRADHFPYGIDFPNGKATGRFSNGKLPGDFLVSYLGIKDVLPAYAEVRDNEDALLTGATFASACSGLDLLTAQKENVLSLDAQFNNFEKAFDSMKNKFGMEKAAATVENALFLLSAGTSDMMDNYYTSPCRSQQYNVTQYFDILLFNLEIFVKKLNIAGAKRLAVIGLSPLGCLPVAITRNVRKPGSTRACRTEQMDHAETYNTKLAEAVQKMMVSMPNLTIAIMDVFTPMIQMIFNWPKDYYGFKHKTKGCCGSGKVELGPFCSLISTTCEQRSEYIFFDAANPTQSAYQNLTFIFKEKVLPTLLK